MALRSGALHVEMMGLAKRHGPYLEADLERKIGKGMKRFFRIRCKDRRWHCALNERVSHIVQSGSRETSDLTDTVPSEGFVLLDYPVSTVLVVQDKHSPDGADLNMGNFSNGQRDDTPAASRGEGTRLCSIAKEAECISIYSDLWTEADFALAWWEEKSKQINEKRSSKKRVKRFALARG